MTSVFRTIALTCLVAAALHFVWENSHVGLYAEYEGISGDLPVTLWATFGDVLYTLVALALASLFKKGIEWLRDASWHDYIGLACLGFFIALYVEYKALALRRWAYLPDMPIFEPFGVGLSPVLQMALLLPLTVAIVALIERRLARGTIAA
jgi:amino acid transporter